MSPTGVITAIARRTHAGGTMTFGVIDAPIISIVANAAVAAA